jgi:hypothetical protein
VDGSALVNQPRGKLRTGKNVVVTDGSVFVADRMTLGNATNAYSVVTNLLKLGQSVTVRDGSGSAPPPTGPLPLLTPLCDPLPSFGCGTEEVRVQTGQVLGPLAPGSYGAVRILNGGTLLLQPGDYEFCSVKLGRVAQFLTDGVTTVNVVSTFTVGSGSYIGPKPGTDQTPEINILGRSVRVSQGATLRAAIVAPNAKFTFGRDSIFQGCFCSDQAKTDKHITVGCVP